MVDGLNFEFYWTVYFLILPRTCHYEKELLQLDPLDAWLSTDHAISLLPAETLCLTEFNPHGPKIQM
jgi:hypothetical protein